MALPAAAFPLRTAGAKILAADGTPVRLAGVNWGGAQQDEGVLYGLDRIARGDLIDRIADTWRLNHARIPFAVGAIMNNNGAVKTAKAPPGRLAKNADLAGLSPWQVLQQVVDDMTVNRVAAGKDPLYAILNQHLLFPGWCCSGADANGLHYNANWPASTFFACWKLIAQRFARNPYVGYDLHNEWRPAVIGGATVTPTWGTGNPKTDARLCYQQAIDQIRAIDPDCLCFCEGLSYASDLTGWKNHPVGRGGVVASMHDYSWFHPAGQTQAAYEASMDAKGGYLVTEDIAPLWVGEFGWNTDTPTAAMKTGWPPQFLAYAAKRGLHWCWWELSATAVLGTEPSTNVVKVRPGQREAFSLAAGQDWGGSQVDVLDMFAPIMPPELPGLPAHRDAVNLRPVDQPRAGQRQRPAPLPRKGVP
jgi:endoglucanase